MKRKCEAIQLSLFDDYRERTDNQLIHDLTNKEDCVSDVWEGGYRLERLFNSLTPQRRRIAMAAVELYKRREVYRSKADAIRSSKDIYNAMHALTVDLPNEEFWVIALSNSYRVIAKQRISVGAMDATCVDVRIIMRTLVDVGAVAFAAVHNHPSGSRQPSRQDDKVTQKLKDAAALFDIRLIDHVIMTNSGYYSFSDEGRL